MELGPISKNPRPITNKILGIFLLYEKLKLVDQLKFGYRIQISLNEMFKSSNENCNILFKRFTWWSFLTYLSSQWFLLTQDTQHTEPHLFGVGTNKLVPTSQHKTTPAAGCLHSQPQSTYIGQSPRLDSPDYTNDAPDFSPPLKKT